jgi:hypothetical protein
MSHFLLEYISLRNNGIHLHPDDEYTVGIETRLIVADAPARQMLKGIMGHGAKYG